MENHDDVAERLAETLRQRAGIDGELLTPALRTSLLQLARDVAHGSERRNAPLATYAAGRYIEARCRQGVSVDVALAEVRSITEATLPRS